MSTNNQALEAERDPGVEAGNNEAGAVPEDNGDIEDSGHWTWRRSRLIRDRDGSWGQSRTGRLRRVWYPDVD